MGVEFYSVERGSLGLLLATGWALAPLALLSIVARRMGRGWLLMSLPWLVLLVIGAVYGGPALQFARTSGAGIGPSIWAHLIAVGAPVALVASLIVLAIVGAKHVSSHAERT